MKKRIKVLVVLSGLSAGGAETMYMNLYRKLDRSKYEIDFLTFGNTDDFYADEVLKNGSKILKMTSVRNGGIKGFCNSVKKAITENGPYDVVHSHIDYLSGFVMKIAKKRGVKIRLAHSHNTSAHTYRGSMPPFFLRYMQRLNNQNATACLACSADAAKYMFGEIKAKNTVIINNAIDLYKFTDAGQHKDALRDFKDGKKIILHIGRFAEQKNHRQLISIFNEYIKQYPDTQLLLVGEGELKNNIVEQVKQYKLQDRVHFLGLRSDIPALMAEADVFILPSKFEGLPVTLIEAQAMNLPCVVSSAVKTEVDCGLGLIDFCSLENEDEWINAIWKAIQNRSQKNNFDSMTEKGYNINDNIDAIEYLYTRA